MSVANFAAKSVKNVTDFRHGSDALLEFYLFHAEIKKAHKWAMSYVADPQLLLVVANHIVEGEAQDAIKLYYRVIGSTIRQGNNRAYKEALELLLDLESMFVDSEHKNGAFIDMIMQLIQDHKPKRNMMKLLKEHYPDCFV